jgi:Spy/CpxP family protein refolding chaperone
MKNQNHLLLAAALLGSALLAPSLQAFNGREGRGQAGGTPGIHRAAQAERMAEYLELTDAQKQQMKQLRREHRDAAQALSKNENLTRKEFRDQMGALRKGFAEQRRAILTPEQQKKADELRATPEGAGERRPGRGHGRGPRN